MKLFQKNDHKLILGEAIETLSSDLIPDNSIDLIFVDPPYNIGKNFNGLKDKWPSDKAYLNWCYEWLELYINKLTANGSIEMDPKNWTVV